MPPPSLGLPSSTLTYHPAPLTTLHSSSPRKPSASTTLDEGGGPIKLRIPPASLPFIFAHRQWRAGLLLSDLISSRKLLEPFEAEEITRRTVLELGAGTGLPGIVAARSGARYTLITDYDDPSLISVLRDNVERNLPSSSSSAASRKKAVRVLGHTWGQGIDDVQDWLETEGGVRQPDLRKGFKRGEEKGRVEIILAADCIWDSLSHSSLLSSLTSFLARPSSSSRDDSSFVPHAIFIAGLHTGRGTIVSFLRRAFRAGLRLRRIEGAWKALQEVAGAQGKQEEMEGSAKERDEGEMSDPSSPFYRAWEKVLEVQISAEHEVEEVDVEDEGGGRHIISTRPQLSGLRRDFVIEEREEERRPSEASRDAGGEEEERGKGEEDGAYKRNRNAWITVWGLEWDV